MTGGPLHTYVCPPDRGTYGEAAPLIIRIRAKKSKSEFRQYCKHGDQLSSNLFTRDVIINAACNIKCTLLFPAIKSLIQKILEVLHTVQ